MNRFIRKMFQQRATTLRAFCIFAILFTLGCKTSKEFTGYAYDPPDVTNTVSKIIEAQPKRVIGLNEPKVWITNEFDGARVSDFRLIADSVYEVTIAPELAPINNSPWYAFGIWADEESEIRLRLTYEDANHRYYPKMSTDKINWHPLNEELVIEDSACGCAEISLRVNTDTLWLSAQEIYTFSELEEWIDSLSVSSLSVETIGYSHLNRPIKQLLVNNTDDKSEGTLVIISRQHPPELSGYLTSRVFIEELFKNTETAIKFRKRFKILVYPMANPDGTDNGHWRYNAGGVDLNRDWENFNQPETKAIKAAIEDHASMGNTIIYGLDFHSTDENLFYPILPEIDKPNGDITYPWINTIIEEFKDEVIRIEAFDINSPIFKNWLFKTFKADALTYEVEDEIDRDLLKSLASFAAQSLMKNLLNGVD